MLFGALQKIAKFFVVLTALWVLLFGFSQFGMMDSGTMVNCPFTGHSMSICRMSPLEHIQEWQNMFTTLPAKDVFSILFALILFIVIRKLIPWHKFSVPEIKHLFTKYLSKNNFHILNPLKEAFSRGILNPKLF